jgi:hypothetical protein
MGDNTVSEECLVHVAGAAPMVRQYVVSVIRAGKRSSNYPRVLQLLSEFEDHLLLLRTEVIAWFQDAGPPEPELERRPPSWTSPGEGRAQVQGSEAYSVAHTHGS